MQLGKGAWAGELAGSTQQEEAWGHEGEYSHQSVVAWHP